MSPRFVKDNTALRCLGTTAARPRIHRGSLTVACDLPVEAEAPWPAITPRTPNGPAAVRSARAREGRFRHGHGAHVQGRWSSPKAAATGNSGGRGRTGALRRGLPATGALVRLRGTLTDGTPWSVFIKLLQPALLGLAERIPALLDLLDTMPQAMPHGDASPQNLLVPSGEPGTLVAIDGNSAARTRRCIGESAFVSYIFCVLRPDYDSLHALPELCDADPRHT